MAQWRQSKARQWRKFWVAMYGRQRPTLQPHPEPAHRKPNYDERLAMWRCAGSLSARAIGRLLHRDHHTVTRHLKPGRGEDLALGLALCGREGDAREMLIRLDAAEDFKAQVELCLQTFENWRRVEHVRVSSTLPPKRFAQADPTRPFEARL